MSKKTLFSAVSYAATSGGGGTIGEAGQPGFGCGTYPGPQSDLDAIGLTPMSGYDDPTSENYGNYQHSLGSIMVFIPAFAMRFGRSTAPSYSRDGANAVEIGAPELAGTDGWVLHRAFIDGGQQKLGFFVDKYLCSKKSGNSNIAVSVKNANQISLSSSYENSSSMTGCSGRIYDAITLSRARGETYACVSAFQWSALSILSLACGQAATSAENCAWYDPNHTINFPKGSNNYRKDYNDSSVTFSQHSKYSDFGKTGSGTPFAKTTHNGQACGVADVNGCMWQPLLGVYQTSGGTFAVAKESYKMHDFTTGNYNTSSNFDTVSGFYSSSSGYWGNGSNCAFTTETSGAKRAMCGVFPVSSGAGNSGTALFGNDYARYGASTGYVVLAAGVYYGASSAGVWCRAGTLSDWNGDYNHVGFRAAGYAQ